MDSYLALWKNDISFSLVTSQFYLIKPSQVFYTFFNFPCFLFLFNPFSTNDPLLYPLKATENLRFSDVFRWYRMGTIAEDGLKYMICTRYLGEGIERQSLFASKFSL